jgi:uncharacterized protein (TIGR00251 family)
VEESELACLLVSDSDGVVVPVYVKPRASRSQIMGLHGDSIKIALAAAPVDGEANQELIKFLSKATGSPRRSLELVSGLKGRRKRVRFRGADKTQLVSRLAQLTPSS